MKICCQEVLKITQPGHTAISIEFQTQLKSQICPHWHVNETAKLN